MVLSLPGIYIGGRNAVEPVRKAWEQQRDFLADASHELRTPLTVILTNLKLYEWNLIRNVRAALAGKYGRRNSPYERFSRRPSFVRSDAKQKVLNYVIFICRKALRGW